MSGQTRRRYLDWARGIAVLLMVQAHTFDAWTAPAVRAGAAFREATILGGFAAPLFLLLAGLGTSLSSERRLRATGGRSAAVEAACRRGAEIFGLAFLFRLQAFVVTPGSPLVALLRVDILNVMGPAIIVAGLLWGLGRTPSQRAIICGAAACAVSMVTPIMRFLPLVDSFPIWMQWYFRPAGNQSMFPLFPWAGFVLAGTAVGALVAAARDRQIHRRVNIGLLLVGLFVVAVGFSTASLPSIYRQSSFWTSSPTYFAIRVGVIMSGLALLAGAEPLAEHLGVALEPLQRLGRNSLFVYWIHVELVYGYATWILRRRLPFPAVSVAFLAFLSGLYALVLLKERLMTAWRGGPELASPGASAVGR